MERQNIETKARCMRNGKRKTGVHLNDDRVARERTRPSGGRQAAGRDGSAALMFAVCTRRPCSGHIDWPTGWDGEMCVPPKQCQNTHVLVTPVSR